MTLEIRGEQEYLYACLKGEFSLEEAKRTFLEMLEALLVQKMNKVLFDGQSLSGNPKIIERFYYGEFAAESVISFSDRGLPPAAQFAYLLKEPVLDPNRLGETVAVNRGMNVKAFDNIKDALKWLGISAIGIKTRKAADC